MFSKRRLAKNPITAQVGYDGLIKKYPHGESELRKSSHSAGANPGVSQGSVSMRPMNSTPPSEAPTPMTESPPNGSSSVITAPPSKTTTKAPKTVSTLKGSNNEAANAVEPPAKKFSVGEGVSIEGKIEGCSEATIRGKVRGTVSAHRLEIFRKGRMEGIANVKTAEIGGLFEGNLAVSKSLKILSTGRLKGEVSFGSIVIDKGGKLEGKVNFSSTRPNPATPSSPSPPDPSSTSVCATKRIDAGGSMSTTAVERSTSPRNHSRSSTVAPSHDASLVSSSDRRPA